uniref:L1 transposable element RRM domain-containing protein n=1 Tax=Latimeria chalumnae TaxID=7897 RepID=H3B9G5_LATCH
ALYMKTMGKAEKRTPSPEQSSKKQKTAPLTPLAATAGSSASTISDVLKEIGELKSNLQRPIASRAKDMSAIKQDIVDMKQDIKEIRSRLSEAEHRISEVEDALTTTLLKAKDMMWKKLIDLEGQSRSNLRIFGIKEGIEQGKRDMVPLIQEMIKEIMPAGDTQRMELKRAHIHKPAAGQRPRVVIVRFLHFREKEEVLNFARNIKKVQWRDMDIEIYPDLPREVVEERRRFADVRRICREKNYRISFRYPA